MKRIFQLVTLVLILCNFTIAQAPDTLWTKTFGSANREYSRSVDATSDGGFIIAGTYYALGPGVSDIYLIKTDADGNQQWAYDNYGGGELEEGECVQQTSDGGYIVCGYTTSYGAGEKDVYVIKTDATGDVEWTQTYGTNADEWGNFIQQTDDEGFIIAGTYETGTGIKDFYLIKTDPLGNEQWHNYLGGGELEEGECVQQTSDGGYIICGATTSYGAVGEDVLLKKTNSLGSAQWTAVIGGNGTDQGASVKETDDGGFVVCGNTSSFGAGLRDFYLIKLNSAGNILFTRTYGGYHDDYGQSIEIDEDGDFIMTGWSQSFGTTDPDVYVVKTNTAGDTIWTKIIGGGNSDRAYCIKLTNDGGYIITGETQSYGAGDWDIYLIRLESQMLSVFIEPNNPPIQVPANGGSFNFDVGIQNNTGAIVNTDIWTQISLPGMGSIEVLLVTDLNVPPTTISRERTQAVPAFAPAGVYTYHAFLGDYPWVINYFDSFTFEKLGTDNGGWLGSASDWLCSGESFADEVAKPMQKPELYTVFSAYPNPFNPITTIKFEIPVAGAASLIIYDVNGREVAALIDEIVSTGIHEATFDGSELSSGIYFAHLETGSYRSVRKLLLIK